MPKFRGEVSIKIRVPFEIEADTKSQADFMISEHYCLSDWVKYFILPVFEKEMCSCYRAEEPEIHTIYEVKK